MPDTVSANLRMILRALLAALGAWGIKPVLALVLYRRISRTMGRIERMLVRFRAGQLWRVTQRTVVPGPKVARNQAARLPRKFGWLVQASRQQAVCFGLQLQIVLSTPEMVELLASSAQARRVLQPLCRALAVELPWTVNQARRTATDGGVATRRKPRVKPEPFRIPLPRGVLTAARKQGFGKMC